MRLWNGHRWFEYETTPISAETIEDAVVQTLSGTLQRHEDGELDDPMESLETCSHPEIVPCEDNPDFDYDDEDHAKGLPDE